MWQAVADAETSRRAWAAIDEIERHLVTHLTPSLSSTEQVKTAMSPGGDIGLVLFFAYLEAARPGSGAAERALDVLGRYIDSLPETDVSPALYGGFCGLGWVTEHLIRRFFEGPSDLTSEIDAALRALLEGPSYFKHYELIRGLSGFGTYLLERLPHPESYELLSRILDHLQATVEDSPAGCTWWTPPRPQFPQGCYNLGVAHGIPGVLGFLAEANRAGLTDPRIALYAEGSVHWLLAHRLRDGDSAFPAWIVPDSEPVPTRTAWCYGDLGIAVVLLSAARSFGRPDWESEALALAHLAARRSIEAAQAIDCSLCHGTAGASHLFLRLYQATGDPLLKTTALAWLERTLAMRRPGEGFAGFLTWVNTMEPNGGSWRGEPGFLMGAAGVGLTLLGAVTDIEPAWDRLLLTSVPPRPRPAAETARDEP
jgi:lantibiotic modifying enzyme